MKQILILIIIFLKSIVCLSQTQYKQIIIPLDNSKGIPFSRPEEAMDYSVGGFEIDQQGDFYFFGGDKTSLLAVFNGNKPIFRKDFGERFGDDYLYIFSDKLYIFDYW